MMKHTEFAAYIKKGVHQPSGQDRESNISIYAASVHDINKMLTPRKILSKEEIINKLPKQLQHHYKAFEDHKSSINDLPPHRPGVDIAIEIEKDEQGRNKDLPRGPLYGMSRDELLCL